MSRFAVAAALLCALAAPAAAEPVLLFCRDYTNDGEVLKAFRDDPNAAGLEAGIAAGGGGMFRLMHRIDGSWVIVLIAPQGDTCIVANGENWTVFELKKGELL